MLVFQGFHLGLHCVYSLLPTPRDLSISSADDAWHLPLHPHFVLLGPLCYLSICVLSVPCSKLHIPKLNTSLGTPNLFLFFYVLPQ